MSHDEDGMTRLLVEHIDAWNSHDLDRLMGLFADDCVFEASGEARFRVSDSKASQPCERRSRQYSSEFPMPIGAVAAIT